MKYDALWKKKLLSKILDTKPHLSVEAANELLDRVLACEDVLATNAMEWVENKAFSDIWVNDKYCVRVVMNIRDDNDFLSAFIALDDYLKDEAKEYALWRPRA